MEEIEKKPKHDILTSAQAAVASEGKTFCVISCLGETDKVTALQKVTTELLGLGGADAIALLNAHRHIPNVQSVVVPEGTKLSKIRGYARNLSSRFVCVCDPDLAICPAGVASVAEQAVQEMPEIAFGLIDCQADGTVLSGIIAIDKWLSHYVLRPILWRLGIGITVPGQFLIVSTDLLKRLEPSVDSYLDDLYFGLFARLQRAKVLRIAKTIGEEESRSHWSSLLAQRIRWMRGLVSLLRHHQSNPRALGFLITHFFGYHVLPIIWFTGLAIIAHSNSFAALLVLVTGILVLSRLTRQPFHVAFVFLIAFPLIHFSAVLFWWMPISRKQLTKR